MDKELQTLEPKRNMPLVNKIKDIHYLIAEHYSDEEPLTDNQKQSRDVFFGYCKDIETALTRLEKLEKAIEICIKREVDFGKLNSAHETSDYNFWTLWKDEFLNEEEFALLKEVFGK